MNSKIYDSVSFQQGMGDMGQRITIEEIDCKICGHDRLLKEHRVNPEHPDQINYYCRYPNCPDHKSANKIVPSII